ncbi:Uncharacterised protein [Moraxella ovis]|nr:Uncharacterised protein [Moraxella ovis]
MKFTLNQLHSLLGKEFVSIQFVSLANNKSQVK